MEILIEVFRFFYLIVSGVIRARSQVLLTFIWVDAPLILLGLVVYMRVRRKRHGKENRQEAAMNNEDRIEHEFYQETPEVFEEFVGQFLEDAEKKVEKLDDLIESEQLSGIEIEEVQTVRSILSKTSSELRQRLSVVVGPESLEGFAAGFRMLFQASNKADEISLRTALEKQKYAYEAKLNPIKSQIFLESLFENKKVFQAFSRKLGYDPEELAPYFGYMAKRIIAVSVEDLFAIATDTVPQPQLPLRRIALQLEAPIDEVVEEVKRDFEPDDDGIECEFYSLSENPGDGKVRDHPREDIHEDIGDEKSGSLDVEILWDKSEEVS